MNFEKFVLRRPTRFHTDKVRIVKEQVYVLSCPKNGCTKLEIQRIGIVNGIKKIVEKKPLSGVYAINYLKETEKARIFVEIKAPFQTFRASTTIPPRYGKRINQTTQRPRYLNEADWAGGYIDCPVSIVTN